MHLTLFLLPLPLLVLAVPVIVEHEVIAPLPIKNHVDLFHPIHPRCVTIRTKRSLSDSEETMRINPHTTSPHQPSNQQNRSLLSRALSIFQLFTPHTTSPHHPSDTVPQAPQPTLLTRTLSRRDSVTISISNTFNSTTVCNSQNAAKFEIVNNAKNAKITVGDKINYTSDFHTFGNKNMLNSTGSNTGWNTKNRDSTLTTDDPHRKREFIGWQGWFNSILMGGDYGRWDMPWRAPAPGSAKVYKPMWEEPGSMWGAKETETRGLSTTSLPVTPATHTFIYTKISTPTDLPGSKWGNKTNAHRPIHSEHARPKLDKHTENKPGNWAQEEHKRDVVNLNIVGGSSNSTMMRSGNNNTIEVYVVGNGDNVVNITVIWEGEENNVEDSGNGNTVRVYIGDSKGVDMGNATLKVVGGES